MSRTHTDFWLMLREIRDYCRANPGTVMVSRDDRTSLTIGFVAGTREWAIGLPDVARTGNRRAAFAFDDETREFIRTNLVQGPEGRTRIAERLSHG